MNCKEFVDCWKKEKDNFLTTYTDKSVDTVVHRKVESLNLSDGQSAILNEAIDELLTDVFYTLLLGLDGAASIGGVQQPYQVLDEKKNPVFSEGELESEAWEQFRENST